MTAGADKSLFTGTKPLNAGSAPVLPSSFPALRSFFMNGPAGRLEALLNQSLAEAPFAALVCHPHPVGGGTIHNKVVYHAAKVFSGRGWPVLRFNFRGVGLSQGNPAGAVDVDSAAEVEDVHAALDWLAQEFGKPIVAAGFSFGAAMGLKAASTRSGVEGFAALGLPTHAEGRDYRYPFLASLTMPKLFLSGDSDEYAPIGQLRAVVASAAQPKQFIAIPGASHFFAGHLPAMQAALRQWLDATFPASPGSHPAAEYISESRIP